MLTERQKEVLNGKKTSYYRKVLSNARKKVPLSLEVIKFLCEIDPKTRNTVLKPMLLSMVKMIIQEGNMERTQPLRIDRGMVRLRKGLPSREKNRLSADGNGELSKEFDGKVMVRLGGVLRDSSGAPIVKDFQFQFVYDLLVLIHERLKENVNMSLIDKTVFDVTKNNLTYSPSYKLWIISAKHELDFSFNQCVECGLQHNSEKKHVVLLRY